MLLLPDRHGLLQRVDAVPRGLERRRRGAATTPRPRPTAPRAQLTDPVQECDPFEIAAIGGALRRRSRPSRAAPVPRTPRRSSRLRPSRPSAWSRTTPKKQTTAPERGVVAHAWSASTGRTASVSTTQSSASLGGESTAKQSTEGAPTLAWGRRCQRPWRAAANDRIPSLHSIAWVSGSDGFRGRRVPTTRTRTTDDDEHSRRAPFPTRSTGSGCTRVSSLPCRPPRPHVRGRCGRRRSWRAPAGAILTLAVLGAIGAPVNRSDHIQPTHRRPHECPDRDGASGRDRGRALGRRCQCA